MRQRLRLRQVCGVAMGTALALLALFIPEARPDPRLPEVRIVYPRDGGVVFSLPHVLLIFDAPAQVLTRNLSWVEIEVDGRPVPSEARAGCLVCAGSKGVVLARKVPWGLWEGEHIVEVRIRPPDAQVVERQVHYTVDSLVPSMTGLSGFVEFPSAYVASAASLRAGFVHEDIRGHGVRVWLGATALVKADPELPLIRPFEFAVSLRLPERGPQRVAYSAKVEVLAQSERRPAWGVGAAENAPFAALGWRTRPDVLEVSVGGGLRGMPRAFVGLSAGPEIGRLIAEYGWRDRLSLGAVVYHPYGVRGGIYGVRERGTWVWKVQLSGSFGF